MRLFRLAVANSLSPAWGRPCSGRPRRGDDGRGVLPGHRAAARGLGPAGTARASRSTPSGAGLAHAPCIGPRRPGRGAGPHVPWDRRGGRATRWSGGNTAGRSGRRTRAAESVRIVGFEASRLGRIRPSRGPAPSSVPSVPDQVLERLPQEMRDRGDNPPLRFQAPQYLPELPAEYALERDCLGVSHRVHRMPYN